MSDVEQPVPIGLILIITVIVSVLVIFTYLSFKANPFLSYIGLSVVLFLVMLIYVDNYSWNPLSVNMNVIGAKGEIASIVRPLKYIGSMEYSIVVSCKKRYAPKERYGYLNNFSGLATILTGNTNVELRGYRHHFTIKEPTDTCPEGAIFYLKGFDGQIPEIDTKMQLMKQDELTELVQKISTKLNALQAQVSTEVQSQVIELAELSNKAGNMMKQLQTPQQPVQIIQNPMGGKS
jgi:hypothetical protein